MSRIPSFRGRSWTWWGSAIASSFICVEIVRNAPVWTSVPIVVVLVVAASIEGWFEGVDVTLDQVDICDKYWKQKTKREVSTKNLSIH